MKPGKRAGKGFTLIELLVVIAIIAILSGLLLPVLSRAKLKARVTSCASNFHQWGVAATLYAEDFHGRFPSFNVPQYIGRNPWDVSSNMIPALPAYSINVAMMFCPARTGDFNAAQDWCWKNLNHPLVTMADLNAYCLAIFGDFGLMLHSWWVPRYAGDPKAGGALFPVPPAGVADPTGWPTRLDDPLISKQPIMTDRCQYISEAGGPNINHVQDGHSAGGKVQSVNLLFGEGHVETRSRNQLKWRYTGNYYGAPQYSFY